MSNWVFMKWNFQKVMSYFRSTTSNLSNCKILPKGKIPKFRKKMPYFLGEDFKTLLLYLKSAPSKLFNL